MADIIHLLPDSVANQIAAGEVIQRPASVVKELMENSIDAAAQLVQVNVVEAGKSLVQVTDDGKGMSETDARLAFERHATSKIARADDLFSLATMGFRGEALASIAAVSEVQLRTRREEDELGVDLFLAGGHFKDCTPIAASVGSTFYIRNLFFNIPARRKFLKSNHTELANVIQEFERVALAHPGISFKLYSNDVLLSDLPAGTFKRRIIDLFGKKYDKQLVSIDVESAMAKISGFVGKPENAKKRGVKQFFFVNGRYMRHVYFSKAVQSAYERLIPEGMQVPFFINIEVDPHTIDVNIHPTKTEIKFEDEASMWQVLQAAVRESLAKFSVMPMIDFNNENKPKIPTFAPSSDPNQVAIDFDDDFNPFEEPQEMNRPENWQITYTKAFGQEDKRPLNTEWMKGSGVEPFETSTSMTGGGQQLSQSASSGGRVQVFDPMAGIESDEENEDEKAEPQVRLFEPSERSTEAEKYEWHAETKCMQYLERYILVLDEVGMYVVDTHRAHVRVLYEQYMKRVKEGQGMKQSLLFPDTIDLGTAQQHAFGELQKDLEGIGFEFSVERDCVEVNSIPAGLEQVDVTALLYKIIDDFLEKKNDGSDILSHTIALNIAQRAAFGAQQLLSEEECRELVQQLFATSLPNYTPDGKRILTCFNRAGIDMIFA